MRKKTRHFAKKMNKRIAILCKMMYNLFDKMAQTKQKGDYDEENMHTKQDMQVQQLLQDNKFL